jgi:DNA repair photolyase
LFENTPDLVAQELLRRRRKPRRVYFSPSSDAFQPLPEVQEVTYRTMAVLLEAGIEVAFLTKGFVGNRFLELFARTPQLVHAQIGITTLDVELSTIIEPCATPPPMRVSTIETLKGAGVSTSARLDPLIPEVTDTHANLDPLLSELRRTRVDNAAVSYLFLRPAFSHCLADLMHRQSGLYDAQASWKWCALEKGLGGVTMMTVEERRRRFARIVELASQHGIRTHVCACKNPDLGANGCEIAGPPLPDAGNTLPALFD